MRLVALFYVVVLVPLSAARSQSAADTAAIDSILLSLVVRELRADGDHTAPVRVLARSDSSWLGRIYAQLRVRHPELVEIVSADSISPREPGLTLKVDVRDLRERRGEVIVIWTRCTNRPSFLNHWSHDRRFMLWKDEGQWVMDDAHQIGVSDGSC